MEDRAATESCSRQAESRPLMCMHDSPDLRSQLVDLAVDVARRRRLWAAAGCSMAKARTENNTAPGAVKRPRMTSSRFSSGRGLIYGKGAHDRMFNGLPPRGR